jgi:kynurenine 3-monooxygenase
MVPFYGNSLCQSCASVGLITSLLSGQGMNCAFEDVRVLATILDHFQASPAPPPNYAASLPLPYSANNPALTTLASPGQSRLGQALAAYSVIRAPSLSAIQQLAASNYAEMASSVLSPLYLFRLSLDTFISKVFTKFGSKGVQGRGGQWESLYRMVTFRYGLAYEESLRRRAVQGKVLEVIGSTAIVGIGSIAVWGTMFGLRKVGGIEKVLSIARNAVGA